MPVGGVGYWPTDFWHDNFWDNEYWTGVGSPIFLLPFINLEMPTRLVSFRMPALGVAAVPDTFSKNPQEVYDVEFDMVDNIPLGATISTAEVYVSRKANASPSIPNLTTTLASTANADATSVVLNANPGVGAYLLLHPTASNEELVLVTAVSGSGPTWTATVDPALAYQHTSGGSNTVSYEPGLSAQLLTTTVGGVSGTKVTFRVQRGVSSRAYRIFIFANLDTGSILRGELDLQLSED